MSKRGFSLAEVVIALAVVGGVSTIVVTYLAQQRKRFAQEEKRELVHGLLEDNIAEVNAKDIAAVPAIGQCLVRFYSLSAEFASESTELLTSKMCKNHIPDTPGIKVIWAVKGSSDISVNYTPSAYLKLPRYAHSVKQITLVGGVRPTADGKGAREYSITTFKRDK